MSNEACFELGLRRADLQCTWCDKLAQFNLDDILKDNCLSCCGVKVEKEPVKVSLCYLSFRIEFVEYNIIEYFICDLSHC